MKKKIFVLLLAIGILLILLFVIAGLLFSIGRSSYPRISLSKEFDSLDSYIQNEFKTNSLGSSFNNRIDIRDCERGKNNKKNTFFVNIGPIYNNKYFDDSIMKKKIDSIYVIINQYLPNKQCFDTISIDYWAIDSTKIGNNNFVYDKTVKYPVKK